jgi:hypothetical protein
MNQSVRMSKDPSPEDHTPEFALTPAQFSPKMQKKPAIEKHPDPFASRSEISTCAHEADMRISPTVLSLTGPALRKMRELETGPLVVARVKWDEEPESEEERGEMREATARALE